MLAWRSSKLTEGRKSKELPLPALTPEPSEDCPKLKGELLAGWTRPKKGSLADVGRKERVALLEVAEASLTTLYGGQWNRNQR